MDWKEKTIMDTWELELSGLIYDMTNQRLNRRLGHIPSFKDVVDFIQQLLDQRDEEIIGKLEKLKYKGVWYTGGFSEEEKKINKRIAEEHNFALDEAISTIKETRKK